MGHRLKDRNKRALFLFYGACAAVANVESTTYELASRPNPGLFSKFFSEKGYQKGKPVPDPFSSQTDTTSAGAQGWSSDADWRARISGLATLEKKSRKSAKLVLAQQALTRLRHWTSGHHQNEKAPPVRQDLLEDAKTVEEAKTLLQETDDAEDASTTSGVTKTSSSAGDLLMRVAPTTLKTSRRTQSTTSVVVNAAGHPRAAGDFCCRAAGRLDDGRPAGKALTATSSEETWTTRKLRAIDSSQRSIDGFFKRFVRKK